MTPRGDPRPIDAEMMALVARLDDAPAAAPLPRPVAAIQPIVHLEAEVTVGYEALARFEGEASPAEHFARAAEQGLDFGAIHKGDGYLFANARDPAGNSVSVSSRAFRQDSS